MLFLQLADEVDAKVYTMGFKTRKVQATTVVSGVKLACKID